MAATGPRDIGVGAGAGVVSGVFGVGGGIVLVPYLVLVRGWEQKRAQATSLVMVAMAATAGLVQYAIAGDVAWGAAAAVLVGGLAGAVIGSAIVARLQAWVLQIAFAALLVVAAARMVAVSVRDERARGRNGRVDPEVDGRQVEPLAFGFEPARRG